MSQTTPVEGARRVPPAGWTRPRATAALVLEDGTALHGDGLGAIGAAVGEVCFNTAMTGYQEILTDPSYAGQIITFTFPHIGIVGVNDEDIETANPASSSGVRGAVLRWSVTDASSYRAARRLDHWLSARGIIAMCGIDTRALTRRIRGGGMPKAMIVHDPGGRFDDHALAADARAWAGIEGADLAGEITTTQAYSFDQTPWTWPVGFGRRGAARHHVVVVDYGAKSNILRELAGLGCEVTVVSARTSGEDILARGPDGVVLSNGPGDPAATGAYALESIRALIDSGTPVFGICLGHQLLALALGAKTQKMSYGHHGANHPVLDIGAGTVEITSMNHGFTVESDTLPEGVAETHRSLFDGTNCGIAAVDRPAFSVQYHPEASPGPQDSRHLFARFIAAMDARARA
jgi:carbamoyl-phosphate synthase small subunit